MDARYWCTADLEKDEAGVGHGYMNARYYDGTRGQFLSEDPMFLGYPKAQDLTNPQNLNSYSYAVDNPTVKSDPSGKCIEDFCIGEALIAYGIIRAGFAAYDTYLTNVQYPQVFSNEEKAKSQFDLEFSLISLGAPELGAEQGIVKGVGGKYVVAAGIEGTGIAAGHTNTLPQRPAAPNSAPIQNYLSTLSTQSNSFLNQYSSTQTNYATTRYSPYGQTISAPASTLPSTVSQNGVTYYRNSFGTLSTTPGQ